MIENSDCFVVLPPNCANDTVIVGRNTIGADLLDVAQEVHLYEAADLEGCKVDCSASLTEEDRFRMILQKPKPGVWGGDYGANEVNVCICISWTSDDCENDCLRATDIVRYALASSETAEDAVYQCGALVAEHGNDKIKSSLLICDSSEVWIFSYAGNLWAAKQLQGRSQRLPNNGLLVTTGFDKSSENLEDALKTLGVWNGEGALNFAACFGAEPTDIIWTGPEPIGDGSYSLTNMFETLRSVADDTKTRAACVSVLKYPGISCHWFTATPNARDSVFKPFIFAPNPRISPLTKVLDDNNVTLLHQLHSKRKPAAIVDLKNLESSCVEEVSAYLAENPVADDELDDLMKDCVEAEVKFYR